MWISTGILLNYYLWLLNVYNYNKYKIIRNRRNVNVMFINVNKKHIQQKPRDNSQIISITF